MRFSDYFNLGKSQAELDFVDVPLDTDLPLYLDPFAISLESGTWFVECNNLIVSFFQLIVDQIRGNDIHRARRLLGNLREPNDTRLGLSLNNPRGSGIGNMQSEQLFERLSDSDAVRTGLLRDLADTELMIPGIGRDKISDMTTNIIRWPLIKYTQAQCNLHGVETHRVAAGMVWDSDQESWRSLYANLPIHENSRILLVPKAAVRYQLSIDHQDYYRKFVLEFLQAEHLDAGSSLVQTLKNGRRRVTKTDLKDLHPLSKDYLYEFSKEHPEVLSNYKETLSNIPSPLTDLEIEAKQSDPRDVDINEMATELDDIEPGGLHAGRYHNFIMGALTAVFSGALMYPVKEQEVNEGRKRIDISYTNRDQMGFFHWLSATHNIPSPYVHFECKNYSSDLSNPEFDQLSGRFSETRGKFGFIVCRTISNRERMIQKCRDFVRDKREYILVLTDDDIRELIRLRARRDDSGIDRYLSEHLRSITF